MKRIILLFTILCSQLCHSQQGWYFTNPKPYYNIKNNKIRFQSQGLGFVLCYRTMFRTLSSSNELWEISTNDTALKFDGSATSFYGISFIDERNGVRCGSSFVSYDKPGVVGFTTNSGATWQSKRMDANFYDVCMLNSNEAIVVGDSTYYNYPKIFRTTNSGATWNYVPSGLSEGALRCIKFIDSNTGFAAGYGGHLIKTTNKGANWTAITTGTSEFLYSIYFIDGNTGIICGDAGTILRTTNSGNNWSIVSSGTSQKLNDIWFTNSSTGFIAGDKKNLLKTNDAGASWTLVTGFQSGSWNNYSSVNFINASTGYISGDSSLILKTTNGGSSWTDMRSNLTTAEIPYIHDFSFPNETTGYFVCEAFPQQQSKYSILKTTNGGVNFSYITPSNLYLFTSIVKIKFIDANTGIIFCNEERGDYWFTSFRTTNGGTSWSITDTLVKYNPAVTSPYLYFSNVEFFNSTTGIVFASHDYDKTGTIFRTTNAGTRWDSIYGDVSNYAVSSNINSTSIVSSNTAYIMHDTIILKTTNTGINWSRIPKPSNIYNFRNIDFLNENTGFVSDNNWIYKTTNGGFNWTQIYDGNGVVIGNFKFVHPDTAYFLSHNAILKSTNGGYNWWGIANVTADYFYRMQILNSNVGYVSGSFSSILKTTSGGILSPITYTINCKFIPEGFYNASTNKMVRKDTARLYVRNFSPPYNLIDSSVSILDSSTVVGIFKFYNIGTGTYYLAGRHRNSIETWSKPTGVTITSFNTNYDFSTSLNQAYGSNMVQIDSSPIRFGVFSGDVNQDGTVDLSDNQLIDNDIYNFVSGYVSSDLNGDNNVDISDAAIADNNSAAFVSKVTP